MTASIDKPETPTYVVSVFEKPHWRTVLMAREIGDKVRVETITPKQPP